MSYTTMTDLRSDDIRVRRSEIHAKHTDRLKAMSPTDPAYRDLWNARADELRALAAERPLTVGEAIIALIPGAEGAGVKP